VRQEGPLVPLAVGNYWLYKSYVLDQITGEVQFSPVPWKFGFIVADTLTRSINNQKIKNYVFADADTTLKPLEFTNILTDWGWAIVYQNNDGFNYSGTQKKDTIKQTFNDLIFPNDAVKGTTWSGHRFYYCSGGDYQNLYYADIVKYSCVSTDSLFKTPIGDFRCVVFKQEYYEDGIYIYETYYFIKPGIGIVGMVQMSFYKYGKKHNYFMKYVLTDYKIN
jgi:hypothetical protein